MTAAKQADGLFITATDTGAGKTTIACRLIPALEALNLKLCIRKPVESGCLLKNHQLYPQDATLLSQASGDKPPLADVCRYRFQAAVSPARAAQLEKTSLSLAELTDACAAPPEQFLLVEGAGGFCSPLTTDNQHNADLAQQLNLPLLLIVADRLGCINHTLLTLEAARRRHLKTIAVIVNAVSAGTDDVEMDNYEEIKSLIGADIPVIRTYFDADGKRNHKAINTLAALIAT